MSQNVKLTIMLLGISMILLSIAILLKLPIFIIPGWLSILGTLILPYGGFVVCCIGCLMPSKKQNEKGD